MNSRALLKRFFDAACPLTRRDLPRALFRSAPPRTRPPPAAVAREQAARFPSNQYNRVERIILVRHGQSLGNVDESTYVDTADWRIPLTLLGKKQARAAGDAIKNILREPVGDAFSSTMCERDGDGDGDGGNDDSCTEAQRQPKIFFYVSPYRRTRQTLRGIMSRLDRAQIVGVREEPRISEQQFGNFQDVEAVQRAKRERGEFGRFFYRFPQGEAGFDVYSRVTSFISTVMRDCAQLRAEGHDLRDFNICIVTHGLTLRLFLMRWFQFTVDEFEQSFNPENGKVIVLERHTNPESGLQWYELSSSALEHLRLPSYTAQKRFRIADDPSLLGVPREGEEEDDAFDWDQVDEIDAEDNPNLDDQNDPRARALDRGNSII